MTKDQDFEPVDLGVASEETLGIPGGSGEASGHHNQTGLSDED